MLNFGLWASKGMVAVPNLSGLSTSEAVTAIQNAKLISSDGGTTSTSTSSLNGKIASQLPNAGDLVDYETSVSYISYNYVAPPPTPTPDPPQNSSISGISISGTTCTITGSFPQNATNISVNNVNIGSWSYTTTSLSFDVSSYAAGTLTVQVYNGRVPLLAAQSVSWGGSTPTPTPSTDPVWITQPSISSTTSSSITYQWQASNAQSWRLTTGGTTLIDEGNAGANGAIAFATRPNLNPSTSYTSTIRVYSGLNQTGTSISSPVSGQTSASTPSGGGGGPSNPTCTASDGTKTYTYGTWSAWSTCSGGTQTRTRTADYSFTRTYTDCSTATITGSDDASAASRLESQNCTNPTPSGATYATAGPNFGSAPSCPAGSTTVNSDNVYVQGSTSTSVSNGSCGSISVTAFAGSGVYYFKCCQS